MTRINLLPWREERKKEKQREFLITLGLTAALGGAIWYGGDWYLADQIAHQEHRNQMLQDEIAELDRQIERIEELETVREQLLGRMNVIEELQAGRPQVVHLFEELAKTPPEGVYLESIEQSGHALTITGVGQSNARVSSYMENLDDSPWLADPDLDVIEVEESEGTRISNFTLRVRQTDPSREEDDGEDAG